MSITDSDTATSKPKTRTDWERALHNACEAYEHAKGRRITARTMIYPAMPAIYVTVDDLVPYGFATAKEAALKVQSWAEAP
jgi:hypothetical protein